MEMIGNSPTSLDDAEGAAEIKAVAGKVVVVGAPRVISDEVVMLAGLVLEPG